VTTSTFRALIDEALHAPVVGWDFSWLDGRATEERPTWAYSQRARSALAAASTALDVDTGGGEVLAYINRFPPLMVGTEAWPPNVAVADGRLRPLGVRIVQTGNAPVLPFRAGCFELVLNRHGTRGRSDSAEADRWWSEVARVLRPGGTFLSQQVGGKGMQELRKAMGVMPIVSGSPWDATMARSVIERNGFVVTNVREEFLRTVFLDVGAIVYYLRMVIWIVPGFNALQHEPELRRIHKRIEADGPLVTHSHRFLVEAQRTHSSRAVSGKSDDHGRGTRNRSVRI
jgi:SAM-dependent methyltransferase